MDQLNQCENEIRVTELVGSIKIVKYRAKAFSEKSKIVFLLLLFFTGLKV